jgi:alkylation response protein AidB-like acyl-CoA dehydrogenase
MRAIGVAERALEAMCQRVNGRVAFGSRLADMGTIRADMRRQVEEWRARQISIVAAKLIIYQAFVESDLDAPKHLARQVHDLYFRPTHPELEPRTLWSLTNALTSAFKQLEPISQLKATAKLAGFLESVRI